MNLSTRCWMACLIDLGLAVGTAASSMVVIDLFYDLLRYPAFFYSEAFPDIYAELALVLPLQQWGMPRPEYFWSFLLFVSFWQMLCSSLLLWKAATPGMSALGLWLRSSDGAPVTGTSRMGRLALQNLPLLIFMMPLAPASLTLSLSLLLALGLGSLLGVFGGPALLDWLTATRIVARTQEVEL